MPAHDDDQHLAATFEAHRPHLRAVAHRMLGSAAEADDAVQETWARLSRSGADGVDNIGGWLTTVVSRVCLNMLRARRTRAEQPLGGGTEGADVLPFVAPGSAPGPVSARPERTPEDEAVLADSVGVALMVVLDALTPAERLAFVLHDLFALPFDEVAAIIGRSPAATRQLASRARRRVRAAPGDRWALAAGTGGRGASSQGRSGDAEAAVDVARQRRVVDAFLAAARGGDVEALLVVLDPDVVLHSDVRADVHGARRVAGGAIVASAQAAASAPALVDGAVGVVLAPEGIPVIVMVMVVEDDRIVDVDVISDADRLATVDIAPLAP